MKLNSRQVSIHDTKIIKLDQNNSPEGILTIAQYQKSIPFKVERIFFKLNDYLLR